MKFAIEIQPTYVIIAPETEVMNKDVAEALSVKVKEGLEANANLSFIIDLEAVLQLTNDAIQSLLGLQLIVEAADGNLVITNTQELVLQKIKQERIHLSIQVTNNMEEAIDLVKDNEAMARGMLNEI